MSKNFLPTQPYKGTRDFYPEDMRLRDWFFGKMRDVVETYGYEKYDGPILESFDLYAAKSGEELVGGQIYHFEDKGKRRLAVRPEMTPTVARMVAARLNELSFPLRWFSFPNLMRYERPQKGRLREHWQLNVDLFGEPSVRADFEIVSVMIDLLRAFGAGPEAFEVRISNRRFFNEVLREVFEVDDAQAHVVAKAVDKRAKIPEEEYRRWLAESGVPEEKARLLDEIFAASMEEICERLPGESRGAADLRELFRLVEATGLSAYCRFDFSIVRGFDYYTGSVFEVYDKAPENRRALFGGGRYDDLVGLFKKSDVSGVGFGFGDVTFQDFLQTHGLVPPDLYARSGVFVAAFEETPYEEFLRLAADLRAAGIPCSNWLAPTAKLKKQLAAAEKSGAAVAVLMGGEEWKRGAVLLKNMTTREQREVPREACIEALREMLADAETGGAPPRS